MMIHELVFSAYIFPASLVPSIPLLLLLLLLLLPPPYLFTISSEQKIKKKTATMKIAPWFFALGLAIHCIEKRTEKAKIMPTYGSLSDCVVSIKTPSNLQAQEGKVMADF
jgi:hypothetical protein